MSAVIMASHTATARAFAGSHAVKQVGMVAVGAQVDNGSQDAGSIQTSLSKPALVTGKRKVVFIVPDFASSLSLDIAFSPANLESNKNVLFAPPPYYWVCFAQELYRSSMKLISNNIVKISLLPSTHLCMHGMCFICFR